MKIIRPNFAFSGRWHIPVRGEFPPQAAHELLNIPNGQLELPGLLLWLANIRAKAIEEM